MTPIPPSSPLSVWVVSDGRAGIQNQALGLAEAVQRLTPAEITIKHIRWRPVFDRLPSALKTTAMLAPTSDPIIAPWPDLWIATGRATLPLSTQVKTWSGGKTFVVQTQDPRWANDRYDMIVAPAHDGLSGDNVFEITGSPHRIPIRRGETDVDAVADCGRLTILRHGGPEFGKGAAVGQAHGVVHHPADAQRLKGGVVEDARPGQVGDAHRNMRHQGRACFGGAGHGLISTRP